MWIFEIDFELILMRIFLLLLLLESFFYFSQISESIRRKEFALPLCFPLLSKQESFNLQFATPCPVPARTSAEKPLIFFRHIGETFTSHPFCNITDSWMGSPRRSEKPVTRFEIFAKLTKPSIHPKIIENRVIFGRANKIGASTGVGPFPFSVARVP